MCTSTEPMAVLLLSLSSSIKHTSVSVSIKELTLLEVLLDIKTFDHISLSDETL